MTAWTIKKLLDWTTTYLMENEIESPHLEAEILLSHALKMKRINLYTSFEKVPSPVELSSYKNMLQRRIKKEPIAYITGTQSFMSLEFKVTPSVLIPRPETETLVEVIVDLAKERAGISLLDVGTGSGAIAISLAKYIKDLEVVGIDLSREAIEVAEENARLHGVNSRCSFIHGSIFEPVDGKKFDFVVSNPPYIPSADIDKLAPDVRSFEPKYALDGGLDGLDYYRKIIASSHDHLKPNGCLALEVGIDQSGAVREMINLVGNFKDCMTIKDLNNIERIVYAKT